MRSASALVHGRPAAAASVSRPAVCRQNLSLAWTLIADTADKRTELSTVTEHSRPNTGR